MKKNLFFAVVMAILLQETFIGSVQESSSANEFVVTKVKSKKETSATVKEEIGETLESCLRQMSHNIVQQAKVQQQIFDKIKDLVGACDDKDTSAFCGSTAQLKEQRHKLQVFHQKLVQQQEELQKFLACF